MKDAIKPGDNLPLQADRDRLPNKTSVEQVKSKSVLCSIICTKE